jgi:adenine C2-methylase RlmN of 23S rRNA A2503 and tRNA A37
VNSRQETAPDADGWCRRRDLEVERWRRQLATQADLLVNIAVNSIIQDPHLENILYAGTGEAFFNIDAVRGQGMMRSTA